MGLYSTRAPSIYLKRTMNSLTVAVMVVVIGLTQGTSPPVPAPAPVPQPSVYRPPYGRPSPFGGFAGGIDPTTLLLLGGGGLGGKGGLGGLGGAHGGINPLMLSLLSCK